MATLAQWRSTIVDEAGNIQPSATVTVRRDVAGAPLATIYSDRAGATPVGNPITAGVDGFVSLHVIGGVYRITAMLGAFTKEWRYVGIGTASEFDAGGIPALVQEVDAGYALRFESGTSAPPSAGAIRFNNANLSLATQAYVSVENLAGSSIEQRLLELYDPARTIKDTFAIADPATDRQASFRIDNAVPNGAPTSYITLTVAEHDGETSFPTGERVNFQPNRAGADGADGLDGSVENVRFKLSANRTYYVRSDGNDSNTGLADAPGGALLTVQKAVDVVYGTLDLGGFDVVIQVRDGTFGRAVVDSPQVGDGNIILQGNNATPANVILTATGIGTDIGVIDVRNNAVLSVRDFAVNTVTSGDCFLAAAGGYIYFQNIRFGASAGRHTNARGIGGRIEATGDYAITAGATVHNRAVIGGIVSISGRTVTLTGTPAFSSFFAEAIAGLVNASANTYSGAATGIRFNATDNGEVRSSSLTDLPGNAAGTVATGGIHPSLVDYATDAQVRAATAGRFVMTVDKIESASAFVNVADAASIVWSWDAGMNLLVTMAGNRTLVMPPDAQAGTWRTWWVQSDGATLRQLSFDGNFLGKNTPIAGINQGPNRRLISILALSATVGFVCQLDPGF